jgi:glutamine cyclotransferase
MTPADQRDRTLPLRLRLVALLLTLTAAAPGCRADGAQRSAPGTTTDSSPAGPSSTPAPPDAPGGGTVTTGAATSGASAGGGTVASGPSGTTGRSDTPVRLKVEVLARHPHDTGAFTEGLAVADGRLFESTGLTGQSTVREVDLASGRVLQRAALPPSYFGEGLADVGDELVQLTWQDGVALVWDRDRLQERRRLPFTGEGWGLCFDPTGGRLVQSDGTATLIFRDPVTFAELGRVAVTREGKPLDRLNELECSDDGVWANVWKTDSIVRIDPASGRVTAVFDASGLRPADADREDVLNGIARQADGTWLVTGKRWPTLYVARFVPA